MPPTDLKVRLLRHGLAEIRPEAWNALGVSGYPPLRHEFLLALETEGCLRPEIGWTPWYLVLEASDGRLCGALPLYLKDNSFGEFVFDGAWADAHERAGIAYFPKLVVASPFTPATGPRLLTASGDDATEVARRLIDAARALAERQGIASLHWLFATDAALAASPGLHRRVGCQFHWHNRGYETFDDFLAQLTSKRRKEILRERRQVHEAGVVMSQTSGTTVTLKEWEAFHALYCHTFAKFGNYPALTLGFFTRVAATLGDSVRLVLARRHGEIIAAAYFLVGEDCLYGRYWGSREEIPGLHFEACYYQGIDYCIQRGLQRFEPGAQGEHKISRGFLPTRTWSYHWLAHPEFQMPIARFLAREATLMEQYVAELNTHSPYRSPG